ncbi:MAG: hypothetical protein Q4A15_00430 [Prevotellaceae bacterium]|nr:hypothetical protein [Prevotellaceae bacterium]
MVKGKTKSGISFKVNESIVNDARTVYFIRKMDSEESNDNEKLDAMYSLLKMVFGGETGMLSFMDTVEKTNGNCAPDTLVNELTEIFETLKAKNS